MVSGSSIECGPQVLSAGLRNTIHSIKEVVGNHSDADIYVALKEENMDPNETIQKLLNQDPFHEVRRKRDRRKENSGNKSSVPAEPRKIPEIVHVTLKYNIYPDRNVRRSVSGRNASHDIGDSKEFRVVRDNRVNQNAASDSKPSQNSISKKNEKANSDGFMKSNSSEARGHHQEPPAGQNSSVPSKGLDNQPKKAKDITSCCNDRKEVGERHASVVNATSRNQTKANGSQQHPTNSSSSPVVGVYSSSSDPVHVPSLHSRPASNVGAIRREVGVVGPRRQLPDNSAKQPPSASSSNSQSGREVYSRESARPFSSDQSSKNMASESVLHGLHANRSSSSSQYGGRPHQLTGNQKASMSNMEWKPKSIVKPSVNGPGVIGSPAKAVSPPAEKSEALNKEASELQGSLSRLNLSENQNVILAPHIRVSETDRCRLTFGSLEMELGGFVSLNSATSEGAYKLSAEPSRSDSVPALESSVAEPTFSKQLDGVDESTRSCGSNSPESFVVSNNQLTEKIESSTSQNLDNYAGAGLVRNNSPPYNSEQLHQQENELSNFSGYEQMGYDISYLRPIADDTVRVPGIPSSQEVLNTHGPNAIPASTIAMVQQQQQQLAQMYPQLHVSHFPNLMQYRQYLSPVYPMPVPGYSNNPAYHPSNGSSFVLLPGSNSHLTPNGTVKYGVQQFKPMPAGGQNGFANFTNPTGYAINTPGIVGSAAGHDDSSRIKYKDSLYVPNPQAETSEMWMNPRDLPGMQSTSYYNMPGQTPHPAYLTSHSGHASFNAAAQSSHMQFPTMYHPTAQQAAIASPHLGPTIGANVGVGVAGPAPGAQMVGAYQQTQVGHLNWAGRF